MLHVLGILNTKSMLNRCIGNMCLFFHKKGNLISRHISVSLIISSDDGCGILERENTGYGFLRDLSAPPSITSIYLVWDWELSLWAIILENMLMFEGIFYFFFNSPLGYSHIFVASEDTSIHQDKSSDLLENFLAQL